MKKTLVLLTLLVVLPGLALCDVTVLPPTGVTASVANPAPAGITFAPGPGGLVGGIGGPIGIVAPTVGTLTISVWDCCLIGDVYETLLDGVSLGTTTPQPIGGGTLSSGVFTAFVGVGAHTIDIWDIVHSYIGVASPFGGGVVPPGYSPAGLTVGATMVPEPATYGLLGAALALIGLLRRKK
jgi:hypothetical protein